LALIVYENKDDFEGNINGWTLIKESSSNSNSDFKGETYQNGDQYKI
jgi:hypothetical protein